MRPVSIALNFLGDDAAPWAGFDARQRAAAAHPGWRIVLVGPHAPASRLLGVPAGESG